MVTDAIAMMQSSFAPRVVIAAIVALAFALGAWLGSVSVARDMSSNNATAIVAGVRAGMAATTPCVPSQVGR